jgi:type II secretory pathway pseudopilin PulG
MRLQENGRRGLTLVEVLALGGIAALAMLAALPALNAAQIFAKRARTENNLKMVALAIANYEGAFGAFPMSMVAGEGRGVGTSGFTSLLPFLEQAPVFNAYNFDLEPFATENHTAVRTRLDVYLAAGATRTEAIAAKDVITPDGNPYPGTNTFGPLHFGMNWGGGHEGFGDDFREQNGSFRGLLLPVVTPEGRKANVTNVRLATVIDGTSNTLSVVEKRDANGWAVGGFAGSEFDAAEGPVYTGDDRTKMRVFTGSEQPKGAWGALADGSIRVLPPTMKKAIWYALLTRNGAEPIPQNAFEP